MTVSVRALNVRHIIGGSGARACASEWSNAVAYLSEPATLRELSIARSQIRQNPHFDLQSTEEEEDAVRT